MYKKIEYKPLYAGEERRHSPNVVGSISGRTNDILLFNNPDRGYRTTMPVVIQPTHYDPDDPTKPCDHCDMIIYDENGRAVMNNDSKCLGKHLLHRMFWNLPQKENERVLDYMFDNWFFGQAKTDYYPKLILLQASFEGCGPLKQLPQVIFDVLQAFLDKCRERDCKVLFRYGYHGVQFNWQVSEENVRKFDGLGASEENILAHIEQMVPFIERNKDILHKLSSGFIGSGGEQAYAYQYPVVNYDNIIKAAVEKLCIPNNLYYTVRYPKIKLDLIENDPDYEHKDLIGHNNDAMFGENENYMWHSGCYQYNHNYDTTRGEGRCHECEWGGTHIKNDWWEYVCSTSAYTPQSGEMFHNQALRPLIIDGVKHYRVPTGMHIIKEVAHQRYVTMSQWNGFVESKFEHLKDDEGRMVPKDATMQRWINEQTVTPEDLDREGIIYDPAWFTDENGNPVHRNPYEFIRDHLGYRLGAQSFELKDNSASLTLKNFGFAAAFNLESGFAVLDADGKVISTVKAGDPEKWYSHDPDNYRSTEILEHNISAELNFPTEKGKYYIGFYLKNTRGDYARLANDIEFIGGFNILCEFEI